MQKSHLWKISEIRLRFCTSVHFLDRSLVNFEKHNLNSKRQKESELKQAEISMHEVISEVKWYNSRYRKLEFVLLTGC